MTFSTLIFLIKNITSVALIFSCEEAALDVLVSGDKHYNGQ